MTIKLGCKAKDATTGFVGTVIQRLDQLNGNTQYALQPAAVVTEPGATYPEAMFIDQHLVDMVDSHLSDRVTEVTHKVDFVLGNEVVDKITGFKGIATERATYMNGCESYFVIPKYDASKMFQDRQPEGSWTSAIRLEYKGVGIAQTITPPPVATNGKQPGGPAQRVARAAVRRSA